MGLLRIIWEVVEPFSFKSALIYSNITSLIYAPQANGENSKSLIRLEYDQHQEIGHRKSVPRDFPKVHLPSQDQNSFEKTAPDKYVT